MKTAKRTVAAGVLVLFVSLSGPALYAGPRDGEVRVPPAIAKILKQLQKFFGISTNEDVPIPPRP